MKVLLSAVSSSCSPDGVGRHAINVARCLLRYADVCRIDVVIGPWQAESINSLLGDVDARIHISVAETSRSAWARNQWAWSGLPKLARSLNSDIVHVTYPVPLRRSAFCCPLVATLHDLYPYDIPENFGYPKVLFNRLFLWQCLRAADKVACVSDTTAQRLEIHFPQFREKALTIHNYVAKPGMEKPTCPLTNWHGEPLLLCVAQHRLNKRIPVAIGTFQALLKSHDLPPDSRLLIVGASGPETSRISRLIQRAGLEDRVNLLQGLSEEELQWCYANCELFLATSIVEGFGMPIVEAMAQRCRVVCSDIPAFREAGGSYCHYVSIEGDVIDSFATAARRVLSSRRFRAVQPERFSCALAGDAYMRLYRALIQEAKPPLSIHPQHVTPGLERVNL
jgi:glycosyltransferase involved in cell wall biosynthesis